MTGRLATIGHSNHAEETLLELLGNHRVQVVVDVRSVPYSRYVPRFNKKELQDLLRLSGFKYLYLGDAIGGKPQDQSCYDARGRVRYDLLTRQESFQRGLDRLEKGRADGWRIVLLCAEEDPLRCHRHWLIARELELVRRVPVFHLRADGSQMRALESLGEEPRQLEIFS